MPVMFALFAIAISVFGGWAHSGFQAHRASWWS